MKSTIPRRPLFPEPIIDFRWRAWADTELDCIPARFHPPCPAWQPREILFHFGQQVTHKVRNFGFHVSGQLLNSVPPETDSPDLTNLGRQGYDGARTLWPNVRAELIQICHEGG